MHRQGLRPRGGLGQVAPGDGLPLAFQLTTLDGPYIHITVRSGSSQFYPRVVNIEELLPFIETSSDLFRLCKLPACVDVFDESIAYLERAADRSANVEFGRPVIHMRRNSEGSQVTILFPCLLEFE